MKTKFWVVLLAVLVFVCTGICLLLFKPSQPASAVRVISEGRVLYTLSLSEATRLEIVSAYGTNQITVKDGKVAVTEADCPDRYCVNRGFCSGGTQIVCLPNRLVLEFTGEQVLDGVAG